MKLIEAVSRRTVYLLNSKNYTQYRLCKEGGIPKPSLFHIVNADKNDVKLSSIWAIADTFGMSLKEFFDDPVFSEVED
ncbi:MAG: helix-turn-helix transcriptional regulator [Bacteroidales bacterium]|nr:helix-turn-helix transcriptional regulator [Bacteroidales bacterium]